jgi:hypothetical protein
MLSFVASEIAARDITSTYIALAFFVCHDNRVRWTKLDEADEAGRGWTRLDEADEAGRS